MGKKDDNCQQWRGRWRHCDMAIAAAINCDGDGAVDLDSGGSGSHRRRPRRSCWWDYRAQSRSWCGWSMEGRRRPHDGAAANYGHVMVSGWWLVVGGWQLITCVLWCFCVRRWLVVAVVGCWWCHCPNGQNSKLLNTVAPRTVSTLWERDYYDPLTRDNCSWSIWHRR